MSLFITGIQKAKELSENNTLLGGGGYHSENMSEEIKKYLYIYYVGAISTLLNE